MALPAYYQAALQGALRLALFDKSGIQAFSGNAASALDSFRLAWVILPMLAAVAWLQAQPGPEGYAYLHEMGLPDGLATRVAVLNVLGDLILWAGFLVVVQIFARQMGKAHFFPRFVEVYNWVLFIRLIVMSSALMLGWLGFVSLETAVFSALIIGFGLLVYQWFAYRVALDIEGALALSLLVFEIMMAFTMAGLVSILNRMWLTGQAAPV